MREGGRRPKSKAGEELVLRIITAHADSLLRTARRHSLCYDDAQDAYQRALEIFMRNADRLEAGRAAAWLHTVVKHEAAALRASRQKQVSADDIDFDAHESPRFPSPEEQAMRFDMVSRSAEALQCLKPQELRALWLKAEGHSYSDIGEITGWSYTKVNRCLVEGRRSFLERYTGIESGAECERWAPVLSALVDGEATAEQLTELRPHLRNCAGCRATLKALQDSSSPIAAVLPVPLVAAAAGGGVDAISGVLMRLHEAIAGGVHERAIGSATKIQSAIETAAAGKLAVVAASAAAVAGGGVATVEQVSRHREITTAGKRVVDARPPSAKSAKQARSPRTPTQAASPVKVRRARKPRKAQQGTRDRPSATSASFFGRRQGASPEFDATVTPRTRTKHARTAAVDVAPSESRTPRPEAAPSPEFATPTPPRGGKSAPEFAP